MNDTFTFCLEPCGTLTGTLRRQTPNLLQELTLQQFNNQNFFLATVKMWCVLVNRKKELPLNQYREHASSFPCPLPQDVILSLLKELVHYRTKDYRA